MNARERIMDRDAVGPLQQTISQQSFLDGLPRVGRADPSPANWPMAAITQSANGDATYHDLLTAGADWIDPGGNFGSLYQTRAGGH
jgi:hypothetical protein